ncbi:stimulated by retinoic acid gene 6 protein-like [Dreissena polymorpha]|uniref:Receptor for retinol uptake STRA6 n=1 Tax=Dreissena polymorpha TaxID=45954 RepID=A0A9D4GFW0_DREPO|nr:stimulated by retinoic acid gene 6 protein-like [Dreissena polymorpha]KAH3816023.1 hypothetical protein DPMN_144563 [Dreissena polymorpha]
MPSFGTIFRELYGRYNASNNDSVACLSSIPDNRFHLWLLLPSSLMIVLLAFSFRRKKLCLSLLGGRPAAIFPMDILGKSNRMSYAAAWGAIAFLTAEMVFGEFVIVDLKGPRYITIWNKVLAMLVIGVGYFPMFAALALDSLISLSVAAIYSLLFLIITLLKIFECDIVAEGRGLLALRSVPSISCLGYLSISIPTRIFREWRKKSTRVFSSSEMVFILNMEKDVDKSAEAEHVRNLLRAPKPQEEPPTDTKQKIWAAITSITNTVFYHNKNKFRYSTRILTVSVMGLILLYKVTLEGCLQVVYVFRYIDKELFIMLESVEREPSLLEGQRMTINLDSIEFVQALAKNLRICLLVAMVCSLVAGIITILHMLTSYRANLLALYKGDNTHIPHRSTMANNSLLIGSMKYAGYQVAYIGWGFVLQFFILSMVCVALCLLITSLMWGITDWLIWLLETVWPGLIVSIIVMVFQKVSAKMFFLQAGGEYLAIDNRRALFSFSFFMFFYNIFIGFFSCLLRIIKSVVIGAIFLPRLDNSALPSRFQMMDPGFSAYVGFINVESSHTHPVVVLFLRILLAARKKQTERGFFAKPERTRTFIRARMRWHTAYSILNNLTLRVSRKHYLKRVKEMQERLAELYHLDNAAAGALANEINRTGVDMKDVEDVMIPGTVLNRAATLERDLTQNRFLYSVKKNLERQRTAFQRHKDGGLSGSTRVNVGMMRNMWERWIFTTAGNKQ